jgi:hypothetical protein
MDDLFLRIAAASEISEANARQAVGYILAYMQVESEDDSIDSMIAATPGAADALGSATGYDGSGGIMTLGARLMGLGLDMGQIRDIAETLVTAAREHAGDETVDRAIASVPALAQFA